ATSFAFAKRRSEPKNLNEGRIFGWFAAMLFRENFVVGCFLEVFSDSSSLPRKQILLYLQRLDKGVALSLHN
ncbi:MAG: hypothetical protein II297_00200, partial [Clostridia bacterium]|nr:hypothetical protein [Clostridia bacterium]